VKPLYCENNGRPALDPVVVFKLLLLGYLYGVRSERQLMREVEVNVAYRWFLGLRLSVSLVTLMPSDPEIMHSVIVRFPADLCITTAMTTPAITPAPTPIRIFSLVKSRFPDCED
jgi:hypothetical protein